MFMMGGVVPRALGAVLVAAGAYFLFRHHREGWKLDPSAQGARELHGE